MDIFFDTTAPLAFKTSTPDWMTDLIVSALEHPEMCICQECDPDFYREMAMDFEPPF